MMTKPGISTLSKCVDSRYTLVTMAAKRARMIGETGKGLVECDSTKPVSIAVNEIAAGKVGYVRHSNDASSQPVWAAYEGAIKYIRDDVDFDEAYPTEGASDVQENNETETSSEINENEPGENDSSTEE